MSEVIEEFIRAHPAMPEGEAFETFLTQDRIRAWVGQDPSRRERLQREFSRVWGRLQGGAPSSGPASVQQAPAPRPAPAAPSAPPGPRAGPSGPAPVAAPRPLRVEVRPDAPAGNNAARRLNLLCPACGRMDVWLDGTVIGCGQCGREYDDMLDLVPVKPVGPFAYVFGEGAKGWLTAAGVALLLLAVYGVLKWV